MFTGECSDMPLAGNSRVHTEGQENYDRAHKSGGWYAQNGSNGYSEPRPEARLRSDAAKSNALKNRGAMGECMTGYANPAPQRTTHPRGVKGEAAGIAQGNKGGGMKNLIENYGNLSVEPPPGPKVKGCEAEEYKEREKGSKYLMNHYSTEPIPANEQPPPARLGLGGDAVAEKHQGKGMGPLLRLEGKKSAREVKQGKLHQTSTGSGWDEAPPQNRMRPEGEDIAVKNSSDSVNDIILQNNVSPPQRKDPKVLKHMTESESPRRAPQQRVVGDGVRNMEKANNHDEMSAIMHGSPNANPARPTSGRRAMPAHLQRSELW